MYIHTEPDPAIDQLMTEMLTEVRDLAYHQLRVVPGYFESAMRVCIKHKLPKTANWFYQEVEAIINPAKDQPHHWNDLLEQWVVAAAATQIPPFTPNGKPEPRAHGLWMKVLKHPHHSLIALKTLSNGRVQDKVDLLAVWWESKSEQRVQDLHDIMAKLLRQGAKHSVVNHLKHGGARWPLDLRMAVNSALAACSVRPVFPPQIKLARKIKNRPR